MQVTIETIAGLERRLTVGVPAERVDEEVTVRLQKAAGQVRIPGFRPGKVPLKVVRQRFGEGIRQEVMGEVINSSFADAVRQEELEPAGMPNVDLLQGETGKELRYTATFEIFPEVEISDLSKLEITTVNGEVTDDNLETMIETFRKNQGAWEDVERAAVDGDQVIIDYKGTKDGEAFEGGSAEDSPLELGSGRMIPGFEEGIVGAKAGEERTLQLAFPDDYHSEDLKGAAVEFAVTVKSVQAMSLAEMNEEFFSKYGVEGDEAAFRVEVRSNMERELRRSTKTLQKAAAMDALLDAHTVQVPQAMVKGEIDNLKRQMFQQFGNMPQDFDMSLLPDDMFTEQADKRVALGLIIRSIIDSAEITADKELVKQEIADIASTYEQPEEVVEYYSSNQELTQSIESSVLENQVVDHILALASVTEVNKSYDEVIAMGANTQ